MSLKSVSGFEPPTCITKIVERRFSSIRVFDPDVRVNMRLADLAATYSPAS